MVSLAVIAVIAVSAINVVGLVVLVKHNSVCSCFMYIRPCKLDLHFASVICVSSNSSK